MSKPKVLTNRRLAAIEMAIAHLPETFWFLKDKRYDFSGALEWASDEKERRKRRRNELAAKKISPLRPTLVEEIAMVNRSRVKETPEDALRRIVGDRS